MESLGMLVLPGVFGLIGAAIAKYKNRNLILWFALSAIFLIIPIVILFFLPKVSAENDGVDSAAQNKPLPIKKIAYIVMLITIAVGYSLYIESEKDEITLIAKANLVSSCNSNSECLDAIEANFERCISQNLSVEKTGRKTRDVVLDNAQLKACVGL